MLKGESSSCGINDLDIDEMVNLMNYKLKSLDKLCVRANKSCNIPRVQELIRKVDPSAYEPIILAIGPYHHGSSSLKALEREKWNCLDYLLKVNRERKLEDYLTLIKDFEQEARTCYSDDINMGQEKFLQMLLLDGCFIVQYFNALDGLLPSTSDTKICCDDSSYYITERMIRANNASDSPTTDEQYIMKNLVGNQKVLIPACTSSIGTCQETSLTIEEVKSSQNNTEQIGNWYHCCVGHDLLLVENQIPFFVVRGIYELFAGNRRPFSFLTDQIALYVEDFVKYYPTSIQKEHRPNDFYHILHLLHMYVRPSIKHIERHQCPGEKGFFYSLAYLGHSYLKNGTKLEDSYHKTLSRDPWQCSQRHHLLITCRRAVQYHQTGVKFKKRLFDKDNPHSLLDISFQNGILEVPYLFIDQSTVSSFRNLIAFEQTCPQLGNDVTAYAVFLSSLVSTPDDVAFLAHKGIIVHQLRSDGEVSAIFAKLGKNADFDLNGSYFLKHVCQALEKHYRSRINRWMAWLWQNHFSNPWLSLAVIAAAIVLFCTVLQTLLALLVYLKSTNGP